MKFLIAIAAASMMAATAATPAAAREGCGPDFHRAMNGMCRPNKGTRARWIEGHYYPGHGYWWHSGWRHHRMRQHGIWIYR